MTRQVKSITWLNLPLLAFQTAGASWLTYKAKRRPFSVRRLRRVLVPDLKRPIFLVGAPRSGTTFLGACLSGLPEISYHFEPVATKAAARYVYEGRWDVTRARRFYQAVYTWLMRVHLDGDLRFAEKTPRNSFIIPFLCRCFTDARFIHIIRDGRDVAVSLSKRRWLQAAQRHSGRREPGGYPYGPYPRFWVEPHRIHEFETTSDIHRCIWSWRRHTEAALNGASCVSDKQYHELTYESLVCRPVEEADALLNFLEIGDSRSRHSFQTAVASIKPDSLGRWKRELSAEQLRQIDKEAGDLLRRLGYAD